MGVGLGQPRLALDDPHPAGRASATAAAHRDMRDAGDAARLQHGVAARHRDVAAFRVGDTHEPVPSAPLPRRPGSEHEPERSGEAEQKRLMQVLGRDRTRRRAGHGRGDVGEIHDFATRLREAEQSQDGDQQRKPVEQPGPASKPPSAAEREPEAEAAVRPGDDERHSLPRTGDGIADPERVDLIGEGRRHPR